MVCKNILPPKITFWEWSSKLHFQNMLLAKSMVKKLVTKWTPSWFWIEQVYTKLTHLLTLSKWVNFLYRKPIYTTNTLANLGTWLSCVCKLESLTIRINLSDGILLATIGKTWWRQLTGLKKNMTTSIEVMGSISRWVVGFSTRINCENHGSLSAWENHRG